MDKEKGDCWYLHTNELECKSCNQIFTTKTDVMNHRKDEHEDEVPLCNDNKEGKIVLDAGAGLATEKIPVQHL